MMVGIKLLIRDLDSPGEFTMGDVSFLPRGTVLGNLSIIEVYESYDKPCLFSCRNGAGQIFLAVWVDKCEDSDLWLYVPVSLKRLRALVTGEMDIRDSFLYAEDRFVFEVSDHHNGDSASVVSIPYNNLTEDKLPLSGEFLEGFSLFPLLN